MAKIPSPWDDNDDKGPWADNDIITPKVKQFKPKKPVEIEIKWWWGVIIVLVIWLGSGFYQVQPNEEAVVLRFGAYNDTTTPGLHYHLPYPIETIKKVIYSVDTPQSLMVSACTLLGNIYSDMNNAEEAFLYYKKALESLDENVSDEVLAELYFKYALANDDRGEEETAYEYYNKCISVFYAYWSCKQR